MTLQQQGPLVTQGNEMKPTEKRDVPSLEFPLRRVPFWNLGLISWVAGSSIGGAVVAFAPLTDWRPLAFRLSVALGVTAIFAGGAVALRAAIRPRGARSIRLGPDAVELPRFGWSERVESVPYADFRAIETRPEGRSRKLVIESATRVFVYPTRRLEGVSAPEALLRDLRDRIMSQPRGQEQWGAIEERARLAQLAAARKPAGTLALLLLFVGVFIAQSIVGTQFRLLSLVDFGANVPALVAEGQWYRLATANFLHGNFVHLFVNLVSLLFLGLLTECVVGTRRLLFFFLLSALGGAAASTLVDRQVLSVGGSGGIFGLIGVLAVLHWRYHRELPAGVRQPKRWWWLVVCANTLLPWFIPQIDFAAHAGGLAIGGLAALLLYQGIPRTDILRAPSRSVTVGAVTLCLLFAAASASIYLRPPSDFERDRIRVVREFAEREHEPAVLNHVARGLAKDPSVSVEALETARVLAKRAVELEPGDRRLLDTLATTQFRLGSLDEAIAIERRVVEQDPSVFQASQLARFLVARQQDGPPVLIGEVGATDVQIRLHDAGESRARAIVVDLSGEISKEIVVIAHVSHRGQPLGLFGCTIGPGAGRSIHMTDPNDATMSFLPPDVQFQVALIDTTGSGSVVEGTHRWWFRTLDPDVAELP